MKKSAAALLLCLVLALPAGDALAAAKTEVVYAGLDNAGQVKGLYIVNEFETNTAETAVDYGVYDKVENLSGLLPIAYDGQKAELSLPAGRFSYQGNPGQLSLPWEIAFSYTLDGQPVEAQALSGVSGQVGIRIQVAPREGQEKITNLLTLQITLTLDGDRCLGIDAPEATVAAAGGNRLLTYVVLPGTSADYTVAMRAEGFYLPAVSIAGTRMAMDGAMYKQYVEKLLAGSPLAAAAGNMMNNLFDRAQDAPPSFADVRNGSVSALQFVLMTEGIPDSTAEKTAENEAGAAIEEDEGLLARIRRLFTN